MADPQRRLRHNAPGDFFVESSCIDCDTCRWMAPETFTARQGQASVHTQPASAEQEHRALLALLSCPTGSIGTEAKHDLTAATAALPNRIDGEVYLSGYHSESSFGAASYLIARKNGNILVDSPRFTRPLVRRLEELGGVDTMFLTHKDDVADHEKFHAHFGCERVLHARDVTARTRGVERIIEGDEPVSLGDDLQGGNGLILPVPGHTAGSCCLLYDDKYLFTGDHIAWSASRGHIYAFRSVCWYSWDELVRSVERLAQYRFEWILPGHGRRCHFDADAMVEEMKRGLEWMRSA